uniref:N-acetyltransferase domain-containing protein n=1 Tax=Graphocephala atropunctata TaxID=36148 RepID=A0A1B6LUA7_9HEMI
MTKWGEKNGIEFLTMPPERAEEALDVLRNGFFEDEAFCNFVGVADDKEGQDELGNMAVACVEDGISIMAVDKQTGKIVGVCYNKLQVSPPSGQKGFFEDYRDSRCKSKTAKALITEMIWFDSLVDLFEKYKTDRGAELMFLGTHKDYRKRGIAIGIVDASLAVVRALPPLQRPPIVTAIFTSPYSIRVGRIFQFDEVIQVPMHDKFLEGKPFSEHPKVGVDHPGSIVMVKTI